MKKIHKEIIEIDIEDILDGMEISEINEYLKSRGHTPRLEYLIRALEEELKLESYSEAALIVEDIKQEIEG